MEMRKYFSYMVVIYDLPCTLINFIETLFKSSYYITLHILGVCIFVHCSNIFLWLVILSHQAFLFGSGTLNKGMQTPLIPDDNQLDDIQPILVGPAGPVKVVSKRSQEIYYLFSTKEILNPVARRFLFLK